MSLPLITTPITEEHDVVFARQRARQVAALLGFDGQDQTRIATAVSEIARNAFEHAGGGTVEFRLSARPPASLEIVVRDRGTGIEDVNDLLDGPAGSGRGIEGARRLMDHFTIQTTKANGTMVTLGKALPVHAPLPTSALTASIAEQLTRLEPLSAVEEMQRQNHEMLRALEGLRERERELRDREEELTHLNAELEATNRGVVALYAELDERAGILQRTSEVKTRYLSTMSHEFRTPLNAILSLSKMLLERMDGALTEEQERQVTYIRRSAEDLSELINDILDLAKVEAGKVAVRAERFEVADLFGTLRGLMRPLLAEGTPVSLVFDDPIGIPPLCSDEAKVSQILRNLISNALKFTERGEVRVSVRRGGDGNVAISVQDTGIGIAPEDHQRVFEEYAQVDNPLQRKVKGTGLGLPLSRKLAELLGGNVTLTSALGQGSTFTLILPTSGRITANQPMAAPVAAPADGPVLVIDDDETARYALRRLLEPYYEVAEAVNGREGLELAAVIDPRLIVLDLAMPEMDGFTALDMLRNSDQLHGVPIIVHTSRDLTADEARRLAEQRAAVVTKLGGAQGGIEAVRGALGEAGLVLDRPEGSDDA